MSQRTLPNRSVIDGGLDGERLTGFPEGVDSFSHPLYMRPTQLRWLENGVTSGGFAQVRPGYKTRYSFETLQAMHPQMLTSFQPNSGNAQLVFAIGGVVYYAPLNSDGSLQTPRKIYGFTFSPTASQIVSVSATQTTTIASGRYANNIVPRNVLIIQDGVNRAGIWDGISGYHCNPTKKVSVDNDGNTLYDTGYNETRIGLWMAWSGNRLWVANGRQVFASDLGDPMHFTEELTINSGQVFTFPSEVTGMIDRGTSGTTRSQLVVFTKNSTWTLWSGIQNRMPSNYGAGWAYTSDFMTKIFSSVGCVAGKSIIVHRGLLYWRAEDGIVLFDSSGTVYATQNLPSIDQEMANSKRRIALDCSSICAGFRDSYVFWSVPVGPVYGGICYNSQTQVLDRQTTVVRSVGLEGPFSYGTTGWQGVWTGIRPVEWANIEVAGQARTYALSKDLDGIPRIWEAFQGNRADNGHEIPWTVETRLHRVAPTLFDTAIFRHFRVMLDQLYGNLSIKGYWRGMRGAYHKLLDTVTTATPGSVFTPIPQYTPIVNETSFSTFALQGRTIRSEDNRGPNDTCTASGVESRWHDDRDHAFSLLLKMGGRGAMIAYRIAVDAPPDNTEGTAVSPSGVVEQGFNIVEEGGCPSHIDGTTPTYTLPDAPNQLAFTPVVPTLDESVLYQAPTT